MMLPKKIFDRNHQKYISLNEQLEFEMKIPNIYERMNYFKENGLDYIDNTPEEIWDAAEEMLLRIEGKYQPTEKEEELQAKFQDALKGAIRKNPLIIPCGDYISGKFLLKNEWLLK